MRFRGGGIGHKVMQDWDELLQKEGHDPADEFLDESDKESSKINKPERNPQTGQNEEVVDEYDKDGIWQEWEGKDEDEDEAMEGTGNIGDGIDGVVADDGEDFDEAIWDVEGYDAL